jgi:hypothetical protein
MKTLIPFFLLLASCSTFNNPIAVNPVNKELCLPTGAFQTGDKIQVVEKSCSTNHNARWTQPICRKEILDEGVVLSKGDKDCHAVKLNHLKKFDQTTFVEHQ